MNNRIRNFFSSLNLKHIGLLEMLFALTPMLSGFGLGSIPLSALMWIIMLVVVFIKFGRLPVKNFKPLTLFVIFWAVHTFVILTTRGMNFNAIIVQIIYFLAFYALFPIIDVKKLEGSLNWVAIISIGGLLYQWSFIAAGSGVHPLEIPGLSMSEERMLHLIERPSSFYMEPASYVAFMIVPLAFSLIRKNFVWTAVIILSVFLTTSTTGIIVSFIMLVAYFSTQRIGKSYMAFVLVMMVGLFYALTHAEVFSAGVEKYENTDTETNIRLAQGPYIVGTMQGMEYVFGAGVSTPYEYCVKESRASMVVIYGESVYMSTLWMMILLYGVVGLVLYLNIYWKTYRKSRLTLPLIACLVAVLFSSGYGIAGTFIFTLIVLLVIAENEKCLIDENMRQ